jgi:hypothetical protein
LVITFYLRNKGSFRQYFEDAVLQLSMVLQLEQLPYWEGEMKVKAIQPTSAGMYRIVTAKFKMGLSNWSVQHKAAVTCP